MTVPPPQRPRLSASERAVVVIPTYNERDSLGEVVGGARAHGFDVLVVDDDSPDGTGALAAALAADDPGVRVRHRAAKTGLGPAYRDGLARALAAGYDVIGQMDADGSHDPDDLPRLRWTLAGCDVAVGSRWAPGGDVIDWPPLRRWLSRAGTAYARAVAGAPLADATSGFRLWRASALRRIDVTSLASDGYAFQIETALTAHRAGLRLIEVPILFVERKGGASKLSRRVVVEALVRVTLWGLRR